jgi:hypothetical protein
VYDFPDLIHAKLYLPRGYDVAVYPGPTCLSVGVRGVSDLQPVHFLGVYGLNGMGLAAEFGYRHELRYVSLYQLMDHGRVLFGDVAVHAALYLLLDVILSGAPCSPDDDSSHTSNSCY